MTWNKQGDIINSYDKQEEMMTDNGVGLDYNDDTMTDENDDAIIFHTGEFGGQNMWIIS